MKKEKIILNNKIVEIITELNDVNEILEVFCNEIQQELDKSVKKESL